MSDFVPFTTPQVSAMWRQEVKNQKTILGLEEWLMKMSEEDFLRAHGLYSETRDLNINSAHDGDWQVAEHYMPGTKSKDASDGPWAIVGDDRTALVKEAIETVRGWFAKASR